MPLDAVSDTGEEDRGEGRSPADAEAFRSLTARLRSLAAAPPAPEPQPALLPAALPETAIELPPPEPPPEELPPPPPDPGETAAALLDVMYGALDLSPQERALAGNALLPLLPHLSDRQMTALAERVAAMDAPPPPLVSVLLRDPRPEVSGVLLERSAQLDDRDAIAAAGPEDYVKLRLIAKRRTVSPALSEHVVNSGDLLATLSLLRNEGASISFRSFLRLAAMAAEHASLQAPLAMHQDLPLAAAMELFWALPTELRRILLARFLTDSGGLARILQIALAAEPHGAAAHRAAEKMQPLPDFESALESLLTGAHDEAARRFASLAGITPETAARIFTDSEGGALLVLFKAMGLSRTRFDDALDRIRAGTGLILESRSSEELKAVFDGLSFNKARVLLIYWDWFTRKCGPYLPPVALVEEGALA